MPNDPLGLDTIDQIPAPPDVCNEQEIAACIGRTIDSISQLAGVLPIPELAVRAFRRSLFHAWTQLLEDCKVCDAPHSDEEGFTGG